MIQKEVPVNTKADTKLKVNALFITWQRSHIAVNKEAALFGCFSDVGGWTKNVPGWLGSIFSLDAKHKLQNIQ